MIEDVKGYWFYETVRDNGRFLVNSISIKWLIVLRWSFDDDDDDGNHDDFDDDNKSIKWTERTN